MLNECSFIGRLGKDPQVTTLESGRKVAQFSLACTERGYKKANGTEVPERTEWIPCVLWGGLAEIAERYLHKGELTYVKGKFRTRKYEDKNGVERYTTEIYADSMLLLPNGSNGGGAPLPPDIEGGAPVGGAPVGGAPAARPQGTASQNASQNAASQNAASQNASQNVASQNAASRTASQKKPSAAMQNAMNLLGDAFGAAPDDDLPF